MHAVAALHSRAIEKRMAAEKRAKIKRFFRIVSLFHGRTDDESGRDWELLSKPHDVVANPPR